MATPEGTSTSAPPGDAQTDASKGLVKASMGIALVTFGLSLMTIDAGVVSSTILATGTALTTGGWSQIRGAQKRLQDKKESEMRVKKALSEAEIARVKEAETRKKLVETKTETEKKLSQAMWQQYSLLAFATAGLAFSAYLWWRSRFIKKEHDVAEEKLTESKNRIFELEDKILCVVCLEVDKSHLFLPCKHLACCGNCAPLQKKCPLCRETVVSIQKKDFYS